LTTGRTLDDIKLHVRLKLFALWTALMFCFIYGDYFELYRPGKLQEMLSGRMALGPVTQGILLAMSAVLAIPSVMGVLSLLLPARLSRWLNLVLGVFYAVIMVLAIQGSWHFYIFFGLIEIVLTALIVWYAWRWPKQSAS
jgi:MFS family permease